MNFTFVYLSTKNLVRIGGTTRYRSYAMDPVFSLLLTNSYVVRLIVNVVLAYFAYLAYVGIRGVI